jgi:hypothetical protein
MSELEEAGFGRRPRRAEFGTRRQASALFLVLTLAALAGVALGILPATGTVRGYLLAVVALAGVLALQKTVPGLGRLERRPRGRGKSPGEEESLPPFFQRAERRLELASASLGQFEQLRPQLRLIAERRLAVRGLRFESEQARELLGASAWRLLERTPAGDKFAPGPEPAELSTLIEKLERI